jgi:hypothetical protein
MVGAGVGKDVKAMRCIAMKMLTAMLVLVPMIICAAVVASMVMMVLMAMLVVMFVLASIHVAVVVFMIMRVLMMMMMDRFGRLVLYYGILPGLKIEDARSCGTSTSAMFAH